MILSSGQVATILGAAPQIGDIPRDTPLALWYRLRTNDPDPFESQKRVSRAVEVGLREMLAGTFGTVDSGGAPLRPASVKPKDITVVKVCLWYTADRLATDGPPPYLLACVQHKLMLAEQQTALVGALFAGGIWCSWSMRAIPEFQASISRALAEFERALESGVPPAVSDEGDLPVAKKLWPKAVGHDMELPPEAGLCWKRMQQLRTARRRMAKESSTLEARLRGMMGSAAVGRAGGLRLGWRRVKTPLGSGRRLVQLT